jgi:hypothetical protein
MQKWILNKKLIIKNENVPQFYFLIWKKIKMPVIGHHFEIAVKYTWLNYYVYSKFNVKDWYVQFSFFKLRIIKF